MEYVYRKDTLPRIKRKFLVRGIVELLFSIAFLASYTYEIDWYLSLVPGLVILALGVGDLVGIKSLGKHRDAIKVYTSDIGFTVQVKGAKAPITWKWNQISIRKETMKRGVLNSFTINTGDRHIKTFIITNDLTSFSALHKEVCEHINV